MDYLVTGCAGFIGSRVCELLLSNGHNVVGLDNLGTTYDPILKEWRLENNKKYGGFRFHQIDISDRQNVIKILKEYRGEIAFEAIFNLAARAGVRASIEDPWVYYETNVVGTLNLLDWACQENINKFILASSSSLYGATNPRPFKEDANTDSLLSPYAASKKAAEVIAYTYHYLHNIDVIVLRYFTVYGPAGRPDMAMFRFIHWIAEGHPVIVYGDGEQERDFTYVDDIAYGTILASGLEGYEILNLGSDNPIKVNKILRMISSSLGKGVTVKYEPPNPADVPATWADISKARELIGWEPRVSIEQGIQEAIEWYLKNQDWASTIKI